MITRGITDITSSESRLGRLVSIASMLRGGPKPLASLTLRIASDLNLRNRSVVRRHLRLAEKLDLLAVQDEAAKLKGQGRALLFLDSEAERESFALTEYGRAYFVESLFRVASVQLIRLMQAIHAENQSPPAAVTIRYFKADGRLPWSSATVRRSLEAYRKTGIVPRLFEHKVTCMVRWLRDLGIVELSGPYELTAAGKQILGLWSDKRETFRVGLGSIAAISLFRATGKAIPTDPAKIPAWLVDEVVNAAQKTRSGLGMASYDEASVFCRLKLLVARGTVVERETFYEALKIAWREDRVRSIILGRNGQPAEIVVPIPA